MNNQEKQSRLEEFIKNPTREQFSIAYNFVHIDGRET